MNESSLKSLENAGYLLKPLCVLWLVWLGGCQFPVCKPPPQAPPCPREAPCQEVGDGRAVEGKSGWTQYIALLPQLSPSFFLYRKPAHHEESDLTRPLSAHEVGEPGGSSGPEPGY